MRAVIAAALTLSLSGCAILASLPPAKDYAPDAQTKCFEDFVWGETVLGSAGPPVTQCAGTPWYNERRKLDGK